MDMRGWTDKDSKRPEYRVLYERHDFLSAYAQHTDMRVGLDPKGAIGRADEWETHADLQLQFLRAHGLTAGSSLLDIGCGTGRLARKAVPFLDPDRYTGVDISPAALDHARALAEAEGWAASRPEFVLSEGALAEFRGRRFDLAWAHSVFTHLPPEAIRRIIGNLAEMEFNAVLFTYKVAPHARRSGLKQFQYPFSFFDVAARSAGLRAGPLPEIWPASQRTGFIRHA
ncbi:class I SAM-dependent methyltransferase [Marinibaculum pumilum]|uniref:Class I SAM-dependent methyltransferase n=1 Tax=Marinibaculum pumilum TaxID=1766165 RepID=A0ABV7KYG4_9PROT